MKPKQQYIVLSFIILTLFLASQINFNCPFFWDEAWSYMRTIDWMGHHNITLNPVAIDPDISRAHPLGFYAFVSLFAKVFGSSNRFFHLFMFIANSVLIFLFTWEFSTEKNTKQSILILALFIFQGVTITQLPFVLPEIFIALLSTLAVLYFFHSRLLPFLLTSIAVVLIKESSIVLLVTLWAYGLLRLFKKKGSMLLLIGLAIPTLIFSVHFMLLKHVFGWYFYPLHSQYFLAPTFKGLLSGLKIIQGFVFLEQGRIFITYSFLLVSIYFLSVWVYKRTLHMRLSQFIKSVYFPLLIYFIAYASFSAFNFLMTRYLIPIVFILIICYVGFIMELIKNKWMKMTLLGIALCYTGYSNMYSQNTWIDDSNLNAKQMIRVNSEAIAYLDKNYAKETTITTHFLMQTYLTKKYAGYLMKDTFKNVFVYDHDFTSDLILISSTEYNEYFMDQLQNNRQPNYFLVKRITHPPAWCEIYKRKN